MSTPNPAKQVLRKQIKEIIKSIPAEEKEKQSAGVIAKIFSLPCYQSARSVSIYLSTPDEVNTLPILKDLFRQQKQVFVPTYRKNVMEMVQLKDWADYESLPLTKWKIKQPSPDERVNCLDVGIDLILMPGVAFTQFGGRMGHGMGYYDKFLSRFFEKYPRNKTKLVAVAFNEQIVKEDDLPLDEHDIKLDLIVTEK